jgi:hypothetical protein
MDQSDIAVQGRNTFRNAVHGLFKSMIDVFFLFYSSNTQFQPGLPNTGIVEIDLRRGVVTATPIHPSIMVIVPS